MIIKKGFTLVEMVIVLGIFGILMVAGTDFLIQAIRNSNRSAMENEVRQTASQIMQDIDAEARKADPLVGFSFPGGNLQMTTVNSNPPRVINYSVISGSLTKTVNGGSPVILNSSKVVVVLVASQPSPGTLLVNLTVQNNSSYTRSDFQAKVTMSDSITARRY